MCALNPEAVLHNTFHSNDTAHGARVIPQPTPSQQSLQGYGQLRQVQMFDPRMAGGTGAMASACTTSADSMSAFGGAHAAPADACSGCSRWRCSRFACTEVSPIPASVWRPIALMSSSSMHSVARNDSSNLSSRSLESSRFSQSEACGSGLTGAGAGAGAGVAGAGVARASGVVGTSNVDSPVCSFT